MHDARSCRQSGVAECKRPGQRRVSDDPVPGPAARGAPRPRRAARGACARESTRRESASRVCQVECIDPVISSLFLASVSQSATKTTAAHKTPKSDSHHSFHLPDLYAIGDVADRDAWERSSRLKSGHRDSSVGCVVGEASHPTVLPTADKCPDASGSRLQVPSVVRASVRVAPGVSRKDTNAHVSWTCQLDHTCMRPFSSPVMMSPVSSE